MGAMSDLASGGAATTATPTAPPRSFFDDLADRAKHLFADPDSPVQVIARGLQHGIASIMPGHHEDAQGTIADGAKPSAAQLRSAPVPMPGKPDQARAEADAKRTLESIDWSKPNIALWVPGTGTHSIHGGWENQVQAAFGRDEVSLALVDYPASTSFNSSVATGMETLKLVLAGIAEHGGDHHVTLSGHSQGAWIIGDSLGTPEIARAVDKATLYGHPGPAKIDWSRSGGDRVLQIDDPADAYTLDVNGSMDAQRALDELKDGRTSDGGSIDFGGTIQRAGLVTAGMLLNPGLSVAMLGEKISPESWDGPKHPHNYDERFAEGARFLAPKASPAH